MAPSGAGAKARHPAAHPPAPESRGDAAGTASGSDAARWLWIGLAILAVLRTVLTIHPSAWFWGYHVQGYVAPGLAWGGVALLVLPLWPPAARLLDPPFRAFGRAIERNPVVAAILGAIALAALVLGFPDRLHYVGDYLLRQGAVQGEENPLTLSPQAFPLDVLLHYTLPVKALAAAGGSTETIARWIGAGDAALLAIAGVVFARALPVDAGARAAAFAVAVFGGSLCLMTGEIKAFSEMTVVAIAFAGSALLALRRASEPAADPPRAAPGAAALLGAGVALAVALLLHRLALGLLPAWGLLLVLWTRKAGARGWRSPVAIAAVAVPLVALALMAPRLWSTALAYDVRANFATPEVGGSHGLIGATLDPRHLLDVVNQLGFLSPLAAAALLAAFPLFARGLARRADALLLGTLLLPYGFVLLTLQPPQGPLRDWEAFAPPAAVVSAVAAWLIARAIHGAPRGARVAAVALGAIVPAVCWLAHFSDLPRGLDRLEAIMTGPPERNAVDRATTWDFIGWKRFGDRDYGPAARAFERACDAAPSPRHLTDWAMAETMLGDHDRALTIYSRAVERDSTFRNAWLGVGYSAINSGRPEAAARAAEALSRLDPGNPKTVELVEWVRRWRAEHHP